MSKNTEIRKLYEITSNENVRSDEIINSCKDSVTIKTRSANLLRNKIDKSTWNDFMSLNEQTYFTSSQRVPSKNDYDLAMSCSTLTK